MHLNACGGTEFEFVVLDEPTAGSNVVVATLAMRFAPLVIFLELLSVRALEVGGGKETRTLVRIERRQPDAVPEVWH